MSFTALITLLLLCGGFGLIASSFVIANAEEFSEPGGVPWLAAGFLLVGLVGLGRLIFVIAGHMLARREQPQPPDPVAALLRDVAERELLPRFRALAAHEIREKSPGEVVTEADLAAEAALTAGFERLYPGAFVVGEEAAAADPSLLDDLARHEIAFVVDPLDGTSHFAAGEEPFGIIAAMLQRGRVTAGWIHLAHSRRTVSARRGQGVYVDGRRARMPAAPPLAEARGSVLSKYLPDDLRPAATAGQEGLNPGEPHRCAAQRYLDHVLGVEHFAFYYRTLPWDHAAGALIVEEAGGVVRRYDGSEYVAADVEGAGLLVAANATIWNELQGRLLPSIAVVERGNWPALPTTAGEGRRRNGPPR